ncbi:hypothetical protein H9623_17420 [Oerskovia sp. Sa1BUA8]|uniref:Uncharacterized protein n=1 Tax=Oerskovia douganii TaxID=2762210 RepID=A0A9D5UCB9_9CELL|nr:hypothetical protein [Oerskovia douganii]MBE7702073.1 hypothetical protein [Oerskovia douganii]
MPLRTPKFLDVETLFALAEYADVGVPLQQEITERTMKNRKGGGKLGFKGSELGGERGTEIEVQTSYTLAPNQKAAVSKVLDQLSHGGHVQAPSAGLALHKDTALVLEGAAHLTTASVAGKLLYVALQAIRSSATSLEDLTSGQMPTGVEEALKAVYLGNELVPVPTLFELEGCGLEPRVLVSVRPGHFVDDAAADQVEGEIGLVGTVESLIEEDDFLNTEKWLLHGWEWLMKRTLMTSMDDMVAGLSKSLAIDLPADDVQAFIPGPAVVIDAVAIY